MANPKLIVNIKTVVYNDKIRDALSLLRNERIIHCANAVGAAANFACGSAVRFDINIEGGIIQDAAFSSNGCGYLLAAADEVADRLRSINLEELHGLGDPEFSVLIGEILREMPQNRRGCADACIEALRAAFADHRLRRIEEFKGERALICTCFGISEDTIESLMNDNSIASVDDVTGQCGAGGGCGSCRMLIQEMLDIRSHGI